MARQMFTISPPQTGAVMPSDSELERLLAIVAKHHSWLGAGRDAFDLEDFRTGFWATTLFFRTPAPRQDRRFSSYIEHIEDVFDTRVGGPSFLAAIIATGEVPWQRQDLSAGRLLEIGVDPYSGMTSRNAWRRVVTGEASLLAPVARAVPGQAPENVPRFRAYRA
jgi:hypothetical protein